MSLDIEKVHNIVDDAILKLVLNFSTYAQFLIRIGYSYKDLGNCIACTDGKMIYINDRLIAELNDKPTRTNRLTGENKNCSIGKEEMMFVFCHELMHLLTATMDRAENLGLHNEYRVGDLENESRLKLWNIATDYAINSLLVNNREDFANKPIGRILPSALYEEKYKEMTAEEIYHKLEKNADEIILQVESTPFGFYLDKHIPINDDLTKSDLAQVISEVFGSKDNDISNPSVDRFVKDVMKPLPFNWKSALTKYIRSWIKENYTWNRPSRAGIANGLILPSCNVSPCIHIALAVDTSGSISNEELQSMLDHVYTILSAFNNFTVDVWCCGSKVYEESLVRYTKVNKSKIKDFKIMSDGGNDMRKNFEFMNEYYKKDRPDVFVCFTDGYDPVDGDEETTCPYPVIWLIVDHPQFVPPLKMKNVVYPYVVDKKKNELC